MNIVQRTTNTLTLTYLRVSQRLAAHPIVQRLSALQRGQMRQALAREEGQGLLEYIIGIAGVFVVAAAVMALYRAIRGKYGEATNSVNSLTITAP